MGTSNLSILKRALTPLDGVAYAGSNHNFLMAQTNNPGRTPNGSRAVCLNRLFVFNWLYLALYNKVINTRNYIPRPSRHPADNKVSFSGATASRDVEGYLPLSCLLIQGCNFASKDSLVF